MRSDLFLIATGLASQALALPACDGDGCEKPANDQQAKDRADAVKAAFQTAWNGYSEYVCAIAESRVDSGS